jgi:inhibitor of cysteine peptidase
MKNRALWIVLILLIIAVITIIGVYNWRQRLAIVTSSNEPGLAKFSSDQDLESAFKERHQEREVFFGNVTGEKAELATPSAGLGAADGVGGGADFSETNIQVAGVDEADIIKTDGKYIYALAQDQLKIVEAYPAEKSKLLSSTDYKDFYPQELFIDGDRLLVFGSETYNFEDRLGKPVPEDMVYARYLTVMSLRLYDVSDRGNPQLIKRAEFEGNYVTSRKIGDDVYFVINTYPTFDKYVCADIVPWYRETNADTEPRLEEMGPIAECTDIGYITPLQAESFITVAGISMSDADREIATEVIVGSGQNAYASTENLYVAQTNWGDYDLLEFGPSSGSEEETIITRFSLDKGQIKYAAAGEVPGHILNQFSMDEFDDHFRIATTRGQVWSSSEQSTNNIYVLDKNLQITGTLEDLAPGESIYSVRFMGERGYLVTFKKIDPLFVVDLSDHGNPTVLGKLKIPGYSDYLHPYDDTHIIGIGKDTVEAEEDLKAERELDFVWYQGVKMAIFDVSDIANPKEMHKVVIGDRGTDSQLLYDHKALLFDKDKNLLVLPILLAEIKDKSVEAPSYGDFVYQGAYVYNVTLQNGFDLRGRITHYDDSSVFDRSGYYFSGQSDISRSLYIENVLYTFSNARLQLNNLRSLDLMGKVNFE